MRSYTGFPVEGIPVPRVRALAIAFFQVIQLAVKYAMIGKVNLTEFLPQTLVQRLSNSCELVWQRISENLALRFSSCGLRIRARAFIATGCAQCEGLADCRVANAPNVLCSR